MLRNGIFAAVALGSAMLLTSVYAGGSALKSGPQAGQDVPGPFHPLNVTGENAGKKACLYCSNGGNPVAVVFAREASAPVTTLIKKIDESTAANKGKDMCSFVVFCSDNEKL